MPACVFKHCTNYSQRPPEGITFHRLPSDPVLLREWLAVIRKNRRDNYWLPSKFCVVCSTHFRRQDMYYTRSGRRFVKKRSKPTLNLVSANPADDTESSSDFTDSSRDGFEDRDYDDEVGQTVEVVCDRPDPNIDYDSTGSEIVESDAENDTPRTSRLKSVLKRILIIKARVRRKLKTLRGRLVRLEARNAAVEIILKRLTDKTDVTFDHRVVRDLFRIISRHNYGRQSIHYPPALKKFCLTLSLYSPKSYMYVRRSFSNCLPHPKTLEVWFNRGTTAARFPRRPPPRHCKGSSSFYESD